MGWNDNMTYEITDKDKEEYEKRMKHFPKVIQRRKINCQTKRITVIYLFFSFLLDK